MWVIIAAFTAAAVGVLTGLLTHCEWSPIVRGRYRNRGWEDGMRWEKPPPPRTNFGYFYWMSLHNTRPTTELTMSKRCFDYYLEGYEQALEHKRWQEGIVATREAHLARAQRLDVEIRTAAKELKEEV